MISTLTLVTPVSSADEYGNAGEARDYGVAATRTDVPGLLRIGDSQETTSPDGTRLRWDGTAHLSPLVTLGAHARIEDPDLGTFEVVGEPVRNVSPLTGAGYLVARVRRVG